MVGARRKPIDGGPIIRPRKRWTRFTGVRPLSRSMGKRESFNRQLLYLVLILVLLVVAVIGAGVAFLQALAGM
jgi:hypothetical protein